ncbi:MFS transporter [Paenibacillus protaetiae]|uniref:DHA2 family efflux MFS transporter permease subunit n=1 Tax=Paenibacillus protaetiae TaxID=2509456 RepID=A0A4P6F1E4_9BACL|nr:MFS transporter [Paenibacillus protaetiae]QAY67939.1 DHA2 family efflux MFS transporter permease subunit [Paenibacillus protaetiae]
MSAGFRTYQEDAAVQSKRWIILIVLNLFTFMSTLDGSIVNIALPVLSKDLGLPIAQIEWVTTSYLMAICTAILFFGKLGDIVGKINIYRIGTFVFVIGSLLCGLSHNLTFLIVSRVVQALGASMTMANSQGILADIFPAKERGRALGLIGTFVSLGSIAGPSVGGILVDTLGWESIFWVNVPIGAIAIFVGWKVLPADLVKIKAKIDVPGSSLFAVFIMTLFTGLLLGQQFSFSNGWIVAALAAAVVSFVYFLRTEVKREHPLIQLSLFRNPLFSVSILCGFLVFSANFCFNIIGPFYAQNMLGLSPFYAGFLLMLMPICMVIVAPLSGALSDKIGSELLTCAGLIVMVIAQFGLAWLHEGSSIAIVGVWIGMLGIGSGLFQSPNNSLVMSQVPRTQLGSAGSVNSLVRNVGMVVGITTATTILFHVMSTKAGYRVTGIIPDRPDLFLSGMHVVFSTSACICLAAAALTVWRMYRAQAAKRAAAKAQS